MLLGIGLYWIDGDPNYPDGYLHWSLVITPISRFYAVDVASYEIIKDLDDKWCPHFVVARLDKLSQFLGVVQVGTISSDYTVVDIDGFIREIPCSDDGWRILGPLGWTSATFVLRCLVLMADSGVCVPACSENELFDTITGKGFRMPLPRPTPFPVLPLHT